MTWTAGRTEREIQGIALAEGRHIRVDGTYNLRDVGGYPTHAGGSVAWRTLLRSARPFRELRSRRSSRGGAALPARTGQAE